MEIKSLSRTILICLTTLYTALFIILSLWQYYKTYTLKHEYLYESEKLRALEARCNSEDTMSAETKEMIHFLKNTKHLPRNIVKDILEVLEPENRVGKDLHKRQTTSSLHAMFQQLLTMQESILEQHCTSSNGTVCSRGPHGLSGVKGNQGIQGDKGLPSLNGLVGDPGYQGPLGPPGDKGQRGLPGLRGSPGMKGEKGLRGDIGDPVIMGLKGEPGSQGLTGSKGDIGLNGPPGLTGAKGFKGQLGEIGQKGDQGPKGPDGKVLDEDCACKLKQQSRSNQGIQVGSKNIVIDCITQYNCDFEAGDICLWKQVPSDNFDWISHRAGTTSTATGPSYDHTIGNVRGTYLYIETSSHNQNEYADLVSPLMTGNQDRCLSLWYHMFGSDIDQLEIGIIQKNQTPANYLVLQVLSGDQGFQWNRMNVTLSSTSDFEVSIRGYKGKGYHGDIAIDDIIVYDGKCQN
ncbi:MAM and LDL-receptor class A domain-containing protein 1,MAM and LDL-receptor class A domain-containing protein 2 [Mytilus edulis]|uniref:MAM and LDL-receptor class A domain-containing protein 1,MAM and LDL-receptor class A domain-containing protein 2 n=1 Tax=Mytilus edulis TaxID=6550 RepID=A0A8S3UJL3_MYTED|nr:MAM and LDL-receptor class A domain-containing protein 1,MAM and LDL-receptor class A domain-containing protein 2 [Mytilus edulis]